MKWGGGGEQIMKSTNGLILEKCFIGLLNCKVKNTPAPLPNKRLFIVTFRLPCFNYRVLIETDSFRSDAEEQADP